MLPESLILVLSATLAAAQSRQSLLLNNITRLSTRALPSPASFVIPAQDQLSLSVALCAASNSIPRFFFSNETSDDPDPDTSNMLEIQLDVDSGQGSRTALFPNGGLLLVDVNGSNDDIPFEIGLSTSDPIHQSTPELPFFGDTTSTQALIFSPSFDQIPISNPSYPNYTLPSALNPQPSLPSTIPNISLILTPTTSTPVLRTSCFLSSQQTTGTITNQTTWARDTSGWREQFLVTGLDTVGKLYCIYGPRVKSQWSNLLFHKSASFPCTLAHSLPYCPSVSYSVPLAPPPSDSGETTYTDLNLPAELKDPLVSGLANFTRVLTTFACGRDWYSPIVGCSDCQREYRKWICSISLPRCAEPSTPLAPPPQNPNQQPLSPLPTPSLLPFTSQTPPRNPSFSNLPAASQITDYNMLLPCLEQCNSADRACPPFIGFKCPTNGFNAGASYGVGFIDGPDGAEGRGSAGASQDRWGNVFCNLL